MFEREFGYNDVYLVPRECVVNSRSECDTSVVFGGRKFYFPAFPANMRTVVSPQTCEFLARKDWFYIFHRFDAEYTSRKFVQMMTEKQLYSSISIGVNDDTIQELKEIKADKLFPEFITLDIAHAQSPKAERIIKWVRENFPQSFLIAGNVATSEAVFDLEKWGAQAIKAGIAGGRTCITKNKTGFHRPMVSTIADCVNVASVPIIADGGVEQHGHIAIALALGATMVCCGSLFAGYDQSASEILEIDGTKKCVIYGSASEHNKNQYKHVEGKRILIDYKGDMNKLLSELQEDLRSSISYAGGNTLNSLLGCKLVRIN